MEGSKRYLGLVGRKQSLGVLPCHLYIQRETKCKPSFHSLLLTTPEAVIEEETQVATVELNDSCIRLQKQETPIERRQYSTDQRRNVSYRRSGGFEGASRN